MDTNPIKCTVVIDSDGDVIGVFDDEHLDRWINETAQEQYDVSDPDSAFAVLEENGIKFVEGVEFNRAGWHRP